MSLRTAATQLADSLPKGNGLRLALRKALQKEAGRTTKWDKTVAGPHARIRWGDEYGGTILIEELPSKGKKRLRRAMFYALQPFGNPQSRPNAFLVDNLTDWMKPSPNMTYEQAMAALKNAIQTAIEYVQSGKDTSRVRTLELWQLSQLNRGAQEEQVFYLEVEPADYSPMMIKGKDFELQAQWGEFEAFSPNSDFQQADPHYSVKEQKSAGAARKLYKMLKADPDALRNVGWHGLGDWLDKNGIGYETHHSQWH